MSKFAPVEFFEGVKYYQGDRSPIPVCKNNNNGLSNAWLHHKGCNKHHPEYWIDWHFDASKCDSQNIIIYNDMPYEYATEMICDWLAAGRTYKGESFTFKDEYKWWQDHKDNIKLSNKTKYFVELVLNGISKTNNIDEKSIKFLYNIAQKSNF